MPNSRKYPTIFVIMLAYYAVVGFLLIPFLVRHFGEKALRENLSPESTIANVRMNPFLLSIEVEGLQTADPAGVWTAEWESFEVDLSAKTFIKFYPVLDLIALDAAAFSFERELREAPVVAEVESEEPSAGWRELIGSFNEMEIPKLHVDLLEVSEGRVSFVDQTNAEPYEQELHPINFSLSNITTVSEDATTMQLSAKTPRGALIEWKGTVETHPLRSAGTFSLQSLDLGNFSPYYDQFTQFHLKRAVFGLSLTYDFDTSDLDNLVSVNDTRVALTELLCEATGENARLLSIDEIVVEGGTFKFPQMELGIERIGVSDGQTLVHRNADGSINLLSLVAVPRAGRVAEVQIEADDAVEESGFTYQVDLIEVTNYLVSWEEDFAEEMASLAVTVPTMRVEGVSSDLESPFTFFADYRIGESGQIVLEGSVVSATPKVDSSVKIKDLALDVGAVYAKELGGLSLDSGVLNVDAQVSYDGTAGVSLDGSAGVTSFAAEYGEELSAQWEAFTVDVSAQFEAARGLNVSGTIGLNGVVAKSGASQQAQWQTLALDVSAQFDEASGLNLTGTADLNSFAASSGSDLEAQFDALALKGIALTTEPMAVNLESVSLDAPVVTVRNQGAAPTNSDGAVSDPVVPQEDAQSTSQPLAVSVGAISVEQGALTFVDESVAPSATIAVSELAVSVNNVDTSSATPVDLDLSAKVNKSPFTLTGKLQPNDLKASTELQFQLSSLSLPAFSSYTGQAVGRRISKGALSLESDWAVQDSQLKASNKILINQLKFGDKVESEDAISLPLDLAVTLLAGPNGDMDLLLPLSGDLSDPKASLGQIIRAAVVGLVTNVAAAPFKILSGLVGSEEDLSVVEFAVGDTSLSNQMIDRLNKMAEALKQRPELKLEIIPLIASEDEFALSQVQLRTQILGDPKLEDDQKFRKGVANLYRDKMEAAGTPDDETDVATDEGLEVMLAVLLPDIQVPASELDRIAAERGRAVSEHFSASHGIGPERLNVGEPEPSEGSIGLRFDLR